MSSNSLISSLFRDNSFASRSSSVLSKSLSHRNIPEERARSQSTHRHKSIPDPMNRNHPLSRLAHILSVKIKKHNYFFFCKLETILKNSRSANTTKEEAKPIADVNMLSETTLTSQATEETSHKARAAENLLDTLVLISSKQNHCNKLSLVLTKLKNRLAKSNACQRICATSDRVMEAHTRAGFDSICFWEKQWLKMDIFSDAVQHLITKRTKPHFYEIRDAAIQIKIQEEQRKREEEAKVTVPQHTKFQELREISEEDSEMVSEEETARFTHSQMDTRRSSQDFTFRHLRQLEVDAAVTPRKELNRTGSHSKKHKKFVEEDCEEDNVGSARNDRKGLVRQTTKIQPNRFSINFSKALRVATCLEQEPPITMEGACMREENMAKCKGRYPEVIAETVPDHDNITFFQQVSSTSQTMKTYEEGSLSARASKHLFARTLEPEEVQDAEVSEFVQGDAYGQDEQILSSPKFREEPNDFVSTPLTKIEEMMLDLERISQHSKSNPKKYTPGYHKCKISVHLPRRNAESTHNSGAKQAQSGAKQAQSGQKQAQSGYKPKNADWLSEKRRSRETIEAVKPWSIKDAREQKENLELKLWAEKEKFLFYPDSSTKPKERKKSSGTGYISSMDHSLLNSARKTTTLMRKEIENIKRSSGNKSRSSLANLKLVRNKF